VELPGQAGKSQGSVEQAAQPARVVRFGVYEIDLEAGELRKHGRRIRLQEQPFQVLALLLENPGRLVVREELQRRIWPADTFVDFDLGLNTAIKKIRATLGDSAEHPKFVETLPKRGYRFIFPVEQIAPQALSPVDKGDQSQPQANPNDVALLPVAVEADVHGKAPGVAKRARYPIWIAAGVLLLVVLLAGLGFSWLRPGTGPKKAGQPVPSVDALLLEEQGTHSAAAHQSYLKGRSSLQAYDMPEKNDNAIEAFKQALQADPNYGLAYAGLGEAFWKKFEATKDHQLFAQAENACNRALELDARRAEAHICQGMIHNGVGLYERAIDDFSVGIELDPRSEDAYRGRGWAYQRAGHAALAEKDYLQATHSDPHGWRGFSSLAQLYLDEGRYEEAARQYEQAIAIRPDNSELRFSLGAAYIETGQYDKAVSALDVAVKMHPSAGAYENAGTMLLNKRRFQEAIGDFQKAIAMAPEDYRFYGNLARAYFWTPDQRGLAREKYERAIAMAKRQLTVNVKDPDVNLSLAIYSAMLGIERDAFDYLGRAQQLRPEDPETAFWAGVMYLQFGNRAKAMVWLRQARTLGYPVAEINAAPELKSLHNDPEFQRLMAKGSQPGSFSP
jgi:tetratricopeptide (TPR) repeat protein/DNA-binding winged helix-turn-helix (wHTH) protein